MYFPKNLITTDLYTNGDEFIDIDGNPYTGYYFSTTFEQYYQGKNPNDDTFSKNINERVLVPRDTNFKGLPSTPYRVNKSVNVKDYKKYLFPNNTTSQKYGVGQDNGIFDPNRHFDFLGGGRADASFYSGDQPASPIYAPITIETFPTEQDYIKGFFTRYFCFKVNEDLFYEINKETYDDIITKLPGWSEGLYVAFKMLWYIKGDEGKIKTLNQELIKLSEQRTQRMGLDVFLKKEYLKYFRIRPGVNLFNSVGLRNYPDREPINMRLPKAYQLGNDPLQFINPNVPAKQHCNNCIFNKAQFCNNWKAEIRNSYWCKSYKVKHNKVNNVVNVNLPSSPQSNLYTSGGEFKNRETGEEYIGFYHIHPDKGPMVGAEHVSTPHEFLDPITDTVVTVTDDPINISPPTPQPVYTPPPSPSPTPSTPSTPSFGGGGYSGGGGGGGY